MCFNVSRFTPSYLFHEYSVRIPWIVRHNGRQVEPKAWDLSSTEQEANWGSSFDDEGWSFSPPNTAITGFYRSHDNNLFNLEARLFGLGDIFFLTFYFVLMAL